MATNKIIVDAPNKRLHEIIDARVNKRLWDKVREETRSIKTVFDLAQMGDDDVGPTFIIRGAEDRQVIDIGRNWPAGYEIYLTDSDHASLMARLPLCLDVDGDFFFPTSKDGLIDHERALAYQEIEFGVLADYDPEDGLDLWGEYNDDEYECQGARTVILTIPPGSELCAAIIAHDPTIREYLEEQRAAAKKKETEGEKGGGP